MFLSAKRRSRKALSSVNDLRFENGEDRQETKLFLHYQKQNKKR